MESDEQDAQPPRKRIALRNRTTQANQTISATSSKSKQIKTLKSKNEKETRTVNRKKSTTKVTKNAAETEKKTRHDDVVEQRTSKQLLPRKFPSYAPISGVANVIHYLRAVENGEYKRNTDIMQGWKGPLIRNASELTPHHVISLFDRRVTAITWHPTLPNIVAVGSKGGELALFDHCCNSHFMFVPGIGPGGSIVGLKFHAEKHTFVYTASITGKIMLQDFHGQKNKILLDTFSFENWFSSLEFMPEKQLLIAGDCKGHIYLYDTNKNCMINKKRLHKSKVTHIEFCHKKPTLFATSSVDHTVKVWDIRKVAHGYNSEPLYVFPHENAVNSVSFSPSNSASLLTTDQKSQLRVYATNTGELQTVIPHPHRHFQHITPIKASWHPLEDIVVVGRFPDDRFETCDMRTIDFYDGYTGESLYRLRSPNVPGIKSLNYFNCLGDTLASGMGCSLIFWRNSQILNSSVCPNKAVEFLPYFNSAVHRSRSSVHRSRSSSTTVTRDKKTVQKPASKMR